MTTYAVAAGVALALAVLLVWWVHHWHNARRDHAATQVTFDTPLLWRDDDQDGAP